MTIEIPCRARKIYLAIVARRFSYFNEQTISPLDFEGVNRMSSTFAIGVESFSSSSIVALQLRWMRQMCPDGNYRSAYDRPTNAIIEMAVIALNIVVIFLTRRRCHHVVSRKKRMQITLCVTNI